MTKAPPSGARYVAKHAQAKEPTLDVVVRNFLDAFKKNDVRFISYVPDNVLTPLIKSVTSDNYFILVNATREDATRRISTSWCHTASTTADRCWWRRRSTTSRAAQTPRDPVLIRQRFMTGLGTGRGAALD